MRIINRSRWFLSLGALVVLAACGSGSNDDSSASRSIQVRIGEPSSLSSLPADQRTVKLELFYFVDGQEGSKAFETSLIANTDRTAWNGRIDSLAPGRYLAKVYLSQPWNENTIQTDLSPSDLPSEESIQNISVALFSSPTEIVVGQENVIIDIAPADFSISIDDDNDGLNNLAEILGTTDPLKNDTDNDGIPDGLDVFPNISTEFGDADGDSVGDNQDNCIQVANGDQTDFDEDQQGDACDVDDDNDGLSDVNELTAGSNPHNADTDGDSARDGSDNCPLTASVDQADSDGDAQGNACDADDDNDGLPDTSDKCSLVNSQDQTDTNGDGTGDICTNDDDGDGIDDTADNCRTVANSDQVDMDLDSIGNACDPDDDNDGLSDVEETTPGVDNLITASLSIDTDGDGIADLLDNCRITTNADQASNGDTDGEGDACDCNVSDPDIRSSDAIFVVSTGNDTRTGARNDPVRTISHGISLAQEAGKTKVYVVSGTYEESVSMVNGISVFGGFNLGSNGTTCDKTLYNGVREVNTVTITNGNSPVVAFHNLTLATTLEGVVVRSSSSAANANLVSITSDTPSATNNITIEDNYILAPDISGGDTTAIFVRNASPVFVNNVIDAGNSQESTAIELMGAPAPKVLHNTIHGGGSDSSSIVLKSRDSVPVLLNNILFTTAGLSQIILNIEDPTPSTNIVVRNNLLFGEQATSPDAPKLYRDLRPSLRIFTLISQLNGSDGNVSGGNIDGNIRFTNNGADTGTGLLRSSLFEDDTRDNYRLVSGSLVINAGLNPASVTGQQVLRDRDFRLRPSGIANDLGAFER